MKRSKNDSNAQLVAIHDDICHLYSLTRERERGAGVNYCAQIAPQSYDLPFALASLHAVAMLTNMCLFMIVHACVCVCVQLFVYNLGAVEWRNAKV